MRPFLWTSLLKAAKGAAVKFTLSAVEDVVKMTARILALLELDENSQQVVKSLKLSGHQVVACETFSEAITILQQPLQIDMIISDVHLENGGNVFDFLRWLKSNPLPRNPLLVLFSFRPNELAKHLEDGVRTSARLLGVALYITMNNFDSDDFRKQIDLLLPGDGLNSKVTGEKQ
jgi:CheY-like chemotaxis protein